jgi:hypothetical protein
MGTYIVVFLGPNISWASCKHASSVNVAVLGSMQVWDVTFVCIRCCCKVVEQELKATKVSISNGSDLHVACPHGGCAGGVQA